jgi:hypothetical protein
MLKSVERDRWIAALLLIGLVVLLGFVVRHFGVDIPEFPASHRRPPAPTAVVPIGRLDALDSLFKVPQLWRPTNPVTPFYTTHFQPPPPKPPTTRKVDLTYVGHFRASGGERRAYVRVGDNLFVGPTGSNVVADLTVTDIALRTLTLKSPTQTNVLEFKVLKQVEVPLP